MLATFWINTPSELAILFLAEMLLLNFLWLLVLSVNAVFYSLVASNSGISDWAGGFSFNGRCGNIWKEQILQTCEYD